MISTKFRRIYVSSPGATAVFAAINTNLFRLKIATAILKAPQNWQPDRWSTSITSLANGGGAVFVDSGEAVSDIRRSDFKTGTGVGVRWASPVGPIKLDFAVPVGDKDEHGLQFYIGLGPEL